MAAAHPIMKEFGPDLRLIALLMVPLVAFILFLACQLCYLWWHRVHLSVTMLVDSMYRV